LRHEPNIRFQWGHEEYIPEHADPNAGTAQFRRISLSDPELPREVKEGIDPEHAMYLYKEHDCIGMVHGEEMEKIKAELDSLAESE
jgi:hypothetical protein